MARRNKDDNVAILILIIIGAMAWGIYVAVKALINLNERFIESVSIRPESSVCSLVC